MNLVQGSVRDHATKGNRVEWESRMFDVLLGLLNMNHLHPYTGMFAHRDVCIGVK